MIQRSGVQIPPPLPGFELDHLDKLINEIEKEIGVTHTTPTEWKPRRKTMNNGVKVRKNELLSILRENRSKHEKEAREANNFYQKKLLEILEKKVADLKAGLDVTHHNIGLRKPDVYLRSYDTVIRMIEMSVDEHIELDEFDFQRYVLNEWDWNKGFAATCMANSKV